MKKDNVEVFFGDELKDQTEQKFLRRLRADLEGHGVPALILANLELGRSRRQLDFVIATGRRTVQCELKGYRYPVIGGENGLWEQLLPDGERRKLGNPGRQAQDATYALSDSLQGFADKGTVAQSQEGRFYRHVDTVLCVYPEIPTGSEIEVPRFVTLRQYEDLLASLTEAGPRVPWTRGHWYEFIRHHRFFRIEEHPELDRRSRAEEYLSKDYCRQFVSGHELDLSTQVPTAARVDESDIEDMELAARLLRDEAVVLSGPSGVGKTLMSDHAAIELARSGALPVWLEAAAYAGDFDALLGRSVAPFTTFPVRELIQVASAAGRRVVLIVDGLNECSPDLQSDLLLQIGSLRLAHQAGVVISCLSPPAVPESLDGHHVEMLLPDRAEKESILRSYDAGQLAPLSDAFTTPFELKIAAECTGEIGEHPTRASVFDAYVGRVCGSESVRALLRAIAWQMHSGLCGSLRVQETVRRLEREGISSAETLDEALECKLLRVGAGLLSFDHESLMRFLAAEAIVIDSADTAALCTALAQPRNEELRGDVLALEPEEERLGATLATLEDEQVLIAAIVGDLGERCRVAVEELIDELFGRARLITDEALPGTRDWELAREWSNSEEALLRAVGRAIHRGRLLPGTIELFEQTDTRCLMLLKERGTLADEHAVSEIVAATYALPFLTSSHWLPATVILCAAEGDFGGRRRGSSSSGAPVQLLERAGARSWGLLLLAAAVVARFDPVEHEVVPELLRKGWGAGADHVQLAVLFLAEDVASSIKGSARAQVKELIERIGINSAEVLDAYDMVAERPLEDVEREVAASLALGEDDEHAGPTARRIVSAQFEPITGPYHEAILVLSDAERAKLYRRAIVGSCADDLSTDFAVIELTKVGDLSNPKVQEAFTKLLRAPGSEKWHSVQWGMRSCLAAINACARFAAEPVLPLDELAGFEGWRAVFSLLFWQERERVESADYSERLRELLSQLREPVVRAGAPAVLCMIHFPGGMMETDEPSGHDRLLQRFPEEIRELFHWSLTHEQELTSCFLHHGAAVRPYAVDMLGMIGDQSSVTLLRSLANDRVLATNARKAIRMIEERMTRAA